MNQITDVLRDSKRLRLIATALELLHYERGDSAVIPIPGTDPQRYVVVGTAATVARLLEIAPVSAEQPSGDLPPLPYTNYNGYSDGSEPLWTAKQMYDYARAGIAAHLASQSQAAPVAYVNGDDLDNMLDDRTAAIQSNPSGWRRTALYLAPTTSTVSAPDEIRLAAYDPNIRWARQRVRLTLKQWDYAATLETTVGGNCHGFEIFDSAISNAWEALPTRGEDVAYVTLTRTNGDELECEDDELNGEDWLKQLVVGIEIVGQDPERTPNKGDAA